MPIYTRTGDDGTTGLLSGKRVLKSNAIIEALGSVDELNAALGFSISLLPAGKKPKLISELIEIQNNLFCLGSNIANPTKSNTIKNKSPFPPTIIPANPLQTDIDKLEKAIDAYDKILKPLHSFILPGGCQAAAALHLARSICRRAERKMLCLTKKNDTHLKYLNRLSDYLFTTARVVNFMSKVKETTWKH